MDELYKQLDLKKLEGILLAAGSGGTAAGTLAGLALHNLNLKVYAVNVLYSEKVIRKKILQLAEAVRLEFNFKNEINEDNLKILNGYSEEGYKKINRGKLELINKFFRQSGILLDPAYTGKAFCGFYENFIQKNKRSKILFLHTGGLFGAFGRRKEYLSINI